VKVLDRDHLDLSKPINRGILIFLSSLAEDERNRILKRANEGRVAAKAKGTKFGRKPKLNEHQQAEVLKRLAADESCRSIGKLFGVHHATIGRLQV
jgi:DNA invertase Pin-like site-specific DNA recombinase